MVGRWSNWVLAAALVATLMAAMHGVMGESLFELLGGSAAGACLFGAALVVFVIAVGLFWERERVQHMWAGKDFRNSLNWTAMCGSLTLFTIAMAAQGVLAFSVAHSLATATHHAYGTMAIGGTLVFLGSTLWLWSKRNKLFVVRAKVEPVERTREPLHAVIAFLSTPGQGQPDENAKDVGAFEAATKLFEETLAGKGWDGALDALCRDGVEFGPVHRWNMQPPLRLLRGLVNAPYEPGRKRRMVFITTPKSDARWERASILLRRVAEAMTKEPKLEILHVEALLSRPADTLRLRAGAFDDNLTLIQLALEALVDGGCEPGALAVDATSATVEASVVGAIATINSRATFIYVNTNDHEVRRFDANATGAWAAE